MISHFVAVVNITVMTTLSLMVLMVNMIHGDDDYNVVYDDDFDNDPNNDSSKYVLAKSDLNSSDLCCRFSGCVWSD